MQRGLAGFITGLDARVGASGRAGIAAGYTGSRNSLAGRGAANVETAHLAAYGGLSFGALNLRAGGAYAFHGIDTDRSMSARSPARSATMAPRRSSAGSSDHHGFGCSGGCTSAGIGQT